MRVIWSGVLSYSNTFETLKENANRQHHDFWLEDEIKEKLIFYLNRLDLRTWEAHKKKKLLRFM